MDSLSGLFDIMNFLADPAKHFALSAFMGSLAHSLTWIIFFAIGLVYRLLTQRQVSMGVVCGIGFCCLLVGLSSALLSHWLLDYFAIWYVTPLGPSLDLIMP